MCVVALKAGVFKLLSSRAFLHLSYNPAGRSHCRLQNHHRGMGSSPGDVGEVPHSPTLTLPHLRHSSFSNPAAAFPTSQLILQHFRWFTHVTAHFQTLLRLYLHHSSLYNSSVASPMSQLILQPFCCFIYATAHSTTLPPLRLCHKSLQPFRCLTYVTGTSRTSPGESSIHRGMKKQAVVD